MIEVNWQPGMPGHLHISVSLEEAADVERNGAIGRRVSLFSDDRPTGWVRVLELRRVDERVGVVEYLLAFAAGAPPAPPNRPRPVQAGAASREPARPRDRAGR